MSHERHLIDVSGLTLRYENGVTAIADFSMQVGPGEFLVILGPSGCGKSSLLKILAGLRRPTEGTVRIGDRDNPPPSLDRAVVFQQPALLPWFTVRDNIAIGLRTAGHSRREARRVAGLELAKVGLQGSGDLFPHQLSGGMQQRVGVARAFAVDPPILLMDEPFAALDSQTRTLLQQELVRMWEGTGKTVVFVTHSIEEALFLADRVLVMSARPGRVKEVVRVHLARPREEVTRYEDEFLKLHSHLWELLRHDAAMAITETE